MRRKVLGDSHADTFASMNNLAALYKNMGRYYEAEPLKVDCLEKRRAALGNNAPTTLNSISNLAWL